MGRLVAGVPSRCQLSCLSAPACPPARLPACPEQVPIRVVYLDRSLAPGGGSGSPGDVHVDEHDFIPEGCPPPARPRVHLLYRPGHYVSAAAANPRGCAGLPPQGRSRRGTGGSLRGLPGAEPAIALASK